MRKDLITTNNIYSSFLSCPKDVQILLQKLFVQSRPYSDRLKKQLNKYVNLTFEDLLARDSATMEKYYKQGFKDGMNLNKECIC